MFVSPRDWMRDDWWAADAGVVALNDGREVVCIYQHLRMCIIPQGSNDRIEPALEQQLQALQSQLTFKLDGRQPVPCDTHNSAERDAARLGLNLQPWLDSSSILFWCLLFPRTAAAAAAAAATPPAIRMTHQDWTVAAWRS